MVCILIGIVALWFVFGGPFDRMMGWDEPKGKQRNNL